MAITDQELWSYEYDDETGRIKINCLGSIYGTSIEDYEENMGRVINVLREVGGASSVVLVSARNYEYSGEQVDMLIEIANVIQDITRSGLLTLSQKKIGNCEKYLSDLISQTQELVTDKMRKDPIGAYVKIKREIRHKKNMLDSSYPKAKRCYKYYIHQVLKPLKNKLEGTQLIKKSKGRLEGYHIGDRSIYREFFHALVRPNFMLTKYMGLPPEKGEELDRYKTEAGIEVQIYKVPDQAQYVYHVNAPEFQLSEDKYTLLDTARRYMATHQPESEEFARPEQMRDVFGDIGRDLMIDLSEQMDLEITKDEIETLNDILIRYTTGLGVLELLLSDKKVQDMYVNSPVGNQPIYIYHQDYEECETNLIPTQEDADSWATRFRIQSGRPLDEANPVLDTETKIPEGRARVAIITKNLSPEGLAFAFRRHRSKPWTLPLFINNNMLNSFSAGLLSFIIDGARTVLFAGTRSAGKTSLLSASLTELMKKHRICTVEDTLELPIKSMRGLGYNVERMKSQSVITQVESELPADEAIRTSLRLGDSVLIIGEVRSTEAKALYEAMRVGALANFVGGTIHGSSAYSVYDRVVNDLGVPKTSFKATDIVVTCNRLRDPSGMETYRRVTGITEVRKEWNEDPLDEGAFVDLMRYDAEKDTLVPTEILKNGESIILNSIANNVREWNNDWNAVWSNIQLRKKVKERIIDLSEKHNNPDLLEAEFSVKANEKFHLISQEVKKEYGELDSDKIYSRWDKWAEKEAKSRS